LIYAWIKKLLFIIEVNFCKNIYFGCGNKKKQSIPGIMLFGKFLTNQKNDGTHH